MLKVSPYIFLFEYQHNGHTISLPESNEVCQGGPIVSSLFINDKRVVKDSIFGGPILFHKNWIFAPRLIRRFLKGSGFQLLGIELDSLRTVSLISFETLILLKEVRNGQVYYFTDQENKDLKCIKLPANVL